MGHDSKSAAQRLLRGVFVLNTSGKALLRDWHLPLLLALAVTVLAVGGEDAREALRYQREAVLAGQWWRLFSAHLVHLGWSHVGLNLSGLVLVWALFARELAGWRGWRVLLVSALAVSLGLLWRNPELSWYVGLSGVLHGLFVAGAWRSWRHGDRNSAILLVAVALKLAWEQFAGPMPGSVATSGGPVVVAAHLYGAVGGVLAGVLPGRRNPTA